MRAPTIEVPEQELQLGRAKVEVEKPAQEEEPAFELDVLGQYLKETHRYPLLSREEEQKVSRAMRRSEAVLEEKKSGNGRRGARKEFDETRATMIESNLRLVVSIAKRYKNMGMELSDLVQEGNIGLMQAVDRFDYRRGVRFSTYAVWWIRQAIQRGLSNTSRTIRMPVHAVQLAWKVEETHATLEQQLGRAPTVEEIAAALDRTPEDVRRLRRTSQPPISLNLHVHDDASEELGDTVVDGESVDPSDAAAHMALQADVDHLFELLTPREQEVMRARFGFDDGVPRSLGEIGRALGISREAARQAEDRALKRLRRRVDRSTLREYLLN
jgi:RNA polymerase primary sigma factor